LIRIKPLFVILFFNNHQGGVNITRNRGVKFTGIYTFDKDVVKVAVDLNRSLKKKRKQIEMADLFIAATAIDNKLPLATLNIKHFDRIDGLELV
jgi:DICT domain-containing protein